MIRPAREDDKDAYLNLANIFYNSDAVSHNIPQDNFLNTFNASINNHPSCHLVMAEYDNIIVGFGLLAITFSCEAGGETVWLEELYIADEYRSKGIGREFFEYTYHKYPNAKRYRLEVAENNTRAIDLYNKLGYRKLDYIQMIIDK